jgi:hypothetical protein
VRYGLRQSAAVLVGSSSRGGRVRRVQPAAHRDQVFGADQQLAAAIVYVEAGSAASSTSTSTP